MVKLVAQAIWDRTTLANIVHDLQVERQIDQMVKFIKQEAEEKANEISVSAEEVSPLQYMFSSSLCVQRGRTCPCTLRQC